MDKVDRPGHFRGVITDYGLHEGETGSISLSFRAKLTAEWFDDVKDWSPCQEATSDGFYCIVLKDGSTQADNAKRLCAWAGWDGELTSIVEQTWTPSPCQFEVKEELFKGKPVYKVDRINRYAGKPGGMGNVGPVRAKEIEAKYGQFFRNIAGQVKKGNQNEPPPELPPGLPEPPPPVDGDIPF